MSLPISCSGGFRPSHGSSPPTSKSVPTLPGRKRKFNVLEQDAGECLDESDSATPLDHNESANSKEAFVEVASENAENAPKQMDLAVHLQPEQQNSSRTPFTTLQSNNAGFSRPAGAQSSKTKTGKRKSVKRNSLSSSVDSSPRESKLRFREAWSDFRDFARNPASTECRTSASPFPSLRWVDRQQMWDLMCRKESGMYVRKTGDELLSAHPAFQPRMRAILLDWLMEVCEVYRLHRETFYLAVDYIDRYMSVTRDMPKARLQLIGITCLFIASKIEEIYPPKLTEFAYVTDGACCEEEILGAELVVLKTLKWALSPMTPNSWLKTFMQAKSAQGASADADDSFIVPNSLGLQYAKAMQIVDLCSLDISFVNYRYSVLAASAMYHTHGMEVTEAASGYTWWDIADCVSWMSAFAFALRKDGTAIIEQKIFHCVSDDDQHNVQSHAVELWMLDRALERLQHMATAALRLSPEQTSSCCFIADHVKLSEHLVTPPPADGDELKEVEQSSRTTLVSVSSTESVFLSPQTPGNAVLASSGTAVLASSGTATEAYFGNTLNPDRGLTISKTVVLK